MKRNILRLVFSGCVALTALSSCTNVGTGSRSSGYADMVLTRERRVQMWNDVMTKAVRAEFCRPYVATKNTPASCAYSHMPQVRSEPVSGAEFRDLMTLMSQVKPEPLQSYEQYAATAFVTAPCIVVVDDLLRFYDASGEVVGEYDWVHLSAVPSSVEGYVSLPPEFCIPSSAYVQFTQLPSYKRYKARAKKPN